GDDDDVHAVEFDIDVGYADTVDQQRRFTTQVFDRVAGKRLEMVDHARLRVDHPVGDVSLEQFLAERDAALADVEPIVVDAHLHSVAHLLEDLGADVVEQGDARRDEHFGPEVRVAARDRRRRVDDRLYLGVDQLVGGDPVEVDLVEDDDV